MASSEVDFTLDLLRQRNLRHDMERLHTLRHDRLYSCIFTLTNSHTHSYTHTDTHTCRLSIIFLAHFLASSQLREFSRKCSWNAQEFSLRNQLKQNAVALIFQICSFWLFSLLYFWLFFVCGFHADKLSANTFGFCVMQFLVISTWSLRFALSRITQSVDCFLLLFL